MTHFNGVEYYNYSFKISPDNSTIHHHDYDQHQLNSNHYNKHVEDLTKLASRLDVSHRMLTEMMRICNESRSNKAWYFNTVEDVGKLLITLEQHQRQLWELFAWPQQSSYLTNFSNLQKFSYEPQQFYSDQLQKELTMVNESMSMEKGDEMEVFLH